MATGARIETHGPMEFIGVAMYGDLNSESEDRAWGLFEAVAQEEAVSRVWKSIYGLHIYHPRFPDRFDLTYMACVAREPSMGMPVGMLSKSLPECRYAVQKAVGGVKGIRYAYIRLYEEYIPSHGLQAAMPIDFEKYCNVGDRETAPDDIEIWVPIEDAHT